ncbi:MAG TPA: HD domain-containing protein [Firmicutes bacterium]|nr:HD domain-containing protein [Bacillota bacterium]
MTRKAERRGFFRVPVNTSLKYWLVMGEPFLYGRLLDLSGGGCLCLFHHHASLAAGDVVGLEFTLPGSSTSLRVNALVRNIGPLQSGDRQRIACEFFQIDEETREQITSFVAKRQLELLNTGRWPGTGAGAGAVSGFNHTRYANALTFALQAHGRQMRKGSPVPYIVHPVAVSAILAQHGMAEDVVLAGLLHDVLEDTQVTFAQLQVRFGEQVARLVQAVSEKKQENGEERSWEVRKKEQLQALRKAPPEVAALRAADLIHNLQSLKRDYRIRGPVVWSYFKRGKEDQSRHFREVAAAVGELLGNHPLALEIEETLEDFIRTVEKDEKKEG